MTREEKSSVLGHEPFTHMYNCAKHFFELELKAQKGEEV